MAREEGEGKSELSFSIARAPVQTRAALLYDGGRVRYVDDTVLPMQNRAPPSNFRLYTGTGKVSRMDGGWRVSRGENRFRISSTFPCISIRPVNEARCTRPWTSSGRYLDRYSGNSNILTFATLSLFRLADRNPSNGTNTLRGRGIFNETLRSSVDSPATLLTATRSSRDANPLDQPIGNAASAIWQPFPNLLVSRVGFFLPDFFTAQPIYWIRRGISWPLAESNI